MFLVCYWFVFMIFLLFVSYFLFLFLVVTFCLVGCFFLFFFSLGRLVRLWLHSLCVSLVWTFMSKVWRHVHFWDVFFNSIWFLFFIDKLGINLTPTRRAFDKKQKKKGRVEYPHQYFYPQLLLKKRDKRKLKMLLSFINMYSATQLKKKKDFVTYFYFYFFCRLARYYTLYIAHLCTM